VNDATAISQSASFLLISAIVLGVVAIALFRSRARRAWLIWMGLLAVAIVGWLGLRTGEGTPTFVLFDGQGKEVKRWQRPPSLSELE